MYPTKTMPHPAQAFFLRGGEVGILLIHGFTGTPFIFHDLGHELHKLGYTIMAPLLAGHGTNPSELEKTNWSDWYNSAEIAYQDLASLCKDVFVVGASFGANIAIQIAAKHQGACGLILIGAPRWIVRHGAIVSGLQLMKLLKIHHFTKSFNKSLSEHSIIGGPNYSYSQIPVSSGQELFNGLKQMSPKLLEKITSPVLLIHSRNDGLIHPASGKYYFHTIISSHREFLSVDAPHHQLHTNQERVHILEVMSDFIATWAS